MVEKMRTCIHMSSALRAEDRQGCMQGWGAGPHKGQPRVMSTLLLEWTNKHQYKQSANDSCEESEEGYLKEVGV